MDNLTKYNERMKGPDKSRIFVSIGLTLLILISFFSGYFTHYAVKGKNVQVVSEVFEMMDKIGFVYDPDTDTYVKIEGDKIAQIIAGNFLDGYSAYYTKEEYEKILAQNSGKYLGIGISFVANSTLDSNVIAKVSVNSPAYNAGILAGDKVVSIRLYDELDSQTAYTQISNGEQLAAFMQMVESDQAVDVIVERQGQPITFEKLVKTTFYMSYVTYQDNEHLAYFSPDEGRKVDNVDQAFECIKINPNASGDQSLGQDTALITLSAFEGDADHQIGAIIKYMEKNGKTRLILNLCGNGGGDMRILTQVASYLIYSQGRDNFIIAKANEKLDGDGVQTEEGYRGINFSVGKNNFNKFITKISILADRNTASASECLIGAMLYYYDLTYDKDVEEGAEGEEDEEIEKNPYEDESKAIFNRNNLIIVGSKLESDSETVYRTYGKGIMQTTYRLQSGGALKITTAKIIWPDNATCIHRVGISPYNEQNKCNTFESALARANQIVNADDLVA